ncbi:MAG: CocE/NonD family hydrolase, partial [Microthrixaceae bacterium]
YRPRTLAGAVVVTAGVLGAACAPTPPGPPPTTVLDPIELRVLGGLEQIYVLGADEGDELRLSDDDGSEVARGTADRLGSWVVRGLAQGRTYTLVNDTTGESHRTRVLVEGEHPPQSVYDDVDLHEGLNYVPMRDGITLAATVRPPIGNSLADGPFPTVIEYSGYQIAAPHEPIVAKVLGMLGAPSDPLAPGGETDFGSLLVRLAGYAVVSVQLRGTGCSGGEADLFDLPTRYDGYDIVEAVATQPWVAGGTVGMVGISFSGFSQIATAATHPPHLSAIAPLSFVGSLYDLAHPGGIFNDGFARSWMAERVRNARPAPDPGALPYANELVRTDADCRYNQRLRLQTRDGDGLIRSESTYGDVYVRRDFRTWMGQIEVPTFASLQFEDEETSSYAMLSAQDLLDANDRVWLNLSSGHHRDSVTPETITQLMEFLDIYVARRPPQIKLFIHLLASIIFGEGTKAPPVTQIWTNTVEDAQRQFEATDRVKVLLELPRGANEGTSSGTRWQFTASSFPVPGSVERTWFLGTGGTLEDRAGAQGTATYHPDPAKRREAVNPPASSGAPPSPTFGWSQVDRGDGVGFVTEPLTEDLVALGPAAASILVSSSAADTDLGLTLSEVRPDGQEMLVATGVQRASMRAVDPAASTATRPAFLFSGAQPLDAVTEVPVQILPVGHVFRAGSRLRLSIAAVGGDRESWAYDSVDPDGGSTTDEVHLGGATPSTLTLTLTPRTGYPASLPPCPSSGKPCRTYTPAVNGG